MTFNPGLMPPPTFPSIPQQMLQTDPRVTSAINYFNLNNLPTLLVTNQNADGTATIGSVISIDPSWLQLFTAATYLDKSEFVWLSGWSYKDTAPTTISGLDIFGNPILGTESVEIPSSFFNGSSNNKYIWATITISIPANTYYSGAFIPVRSQVVQISHNSKPTGSVGITSDSSTFNENSILTANIDNIAPANTTKQYQWYYSGGIATTHYAISGAASNTYSVPRDGAYNEKYIHVKVTASYTANGSTFTETFTSGTVVQIKAVNDSPTGSITLDYDKDSKKLTINTTNVSDEEGGTINIAENFWYAASAPNGSAFGVNDQFAANVTTYTADSTLEGKYIIVLARVKDHPEGDAGGFGETNMWTDYKFIPINTAPIVVDVDTTTKEDESVNFVLGNSASDNDGDTLTFTLVDDVSNGTLVFNPDGTAIYTPKSNYSGSDSFTFKANDGKLDSNKGTVSIDVTSQNDAPTVVNANISINEDSGRSAINIKATDVDSTNFTYSIVSDPSHGTATIENAFPHLAIYVPNDNYHGPDSFTYKANDGTMDSNVATINLTILPVNDKPSAYPATYTLNEDTSKIITLAATDLEDVSASLTYTLSEDPINGTATLNLNKITYTPNNNYNGADSFNYTVTDKEGKSHEATISLNITPVNDTYTPLQIESATIEEKSVDIPLGPTQDVDKENISYFLNGAVSNGNVVINGNIATYTPNKDFTGTDTFDYRTYDGVSYDVATVTVNVSNVNDKPIAVAGTFTTAEDTSYTYTPIGEDVEDGALSLNRVSKEPLNGTYVISSDKKIIYTPNPNWSGVDSLKFTVKDSNNVESSPVTVNITVTAVNDEPTVQNLTINTNEDVEKHIALSGADTEGANLIYSIVDQAPNGNVTITSNNNAIYTPNLNWNGIDTFTYRVSDGVHNSNVATVTITVDKVNDAPIIPSSNSVPPILEDSGTRIISIVATDVENTALTYHIVNSPPNGTVTIDNANIGTIKYTPADNWHGSESFSVKANDGEKDSNICTVNIVVTSVHDNPVADVLSLKVTDEDSDINIQLHARSVEHPLESSHYHYTNPTHGTLSGTKPSLIYSPHPNYYGTDNFEYWVIDNQGQMSNKVTVTIIVEPINDVPTGEITLTGDYKEGGKIDANIKITHPINENEYLKIDYRWLIKRQTGSQWEALSVGSVDNFDKNTNPINILLTHSIHKDIKENDPLREWGNPIILSVKLNDGINPIVDIDSSEVTPFNVEDKIIGPVSIIQLEVKEGDTIEVDTSKVRDFDGVTITSYEWELSDNGSDYNVMSTSKTDDSYKISDSQNVVDSYVRSIVQFKDNIDESIKYELKSNALKIQNVDDEPIGDIELNLYDSSNKKVDDAVEGGRIECIAKFVDEDGTLDYTFHWYLVDNSNNNIINNIYEDSTWVHILSDPSGTNNKSGILIPNTQEYVNKIVIAIITMVDPYGKMVKRKVWVYINNVDDAATGNLTISKDGSYFTVDASNLADLDGIELFIYKWYFLKFPFLSNNWEKMEEQTSNENTHTYVASNDNVGKIKVEVVVVDKHDGQATVESMSLLHAPVIGSGGDPYLVTLNNKLYKMSNIEGYSRMVQGKYKNENLTINVETKITSAKEVEACYKYLENKIKKAGKTNQGSTSHIKRSDYIDINNAFITKIYIQLGEENITIDIDNLNIIENNSNFILSMNSNKQTFFKSIKELEQYSSEEEQSLIVAMGEIDIVVSYSRHPQVRGSFLINNGFLIENPLGPLANTLYTKDYRLRTLKCTKKIERNVDRINPKRVEEQTYVDKTGKIINKMLSIY